MSRGRYLEQDFDDRYSDELHLYPIKFYTFIFVQFLVTFSMYKNVFAIYLLSNKYKYLTFNIIVTLLMKKIQLF